MITFIKTILLVTLIKIVIGTQLCSIGCQDCIINSEQNTCQKCQQGYLLKGNTCQYSECQPNLYFQANTSVTQDAEPVGNCLSICKPLSDIDLISNTCQEQIQCSSSSSTQLNLQNTGIPLDFFIYQSKYYVSLQIGYLSVYNIDGLYLIKNLNYIYGDVKVINLNDQVLVLSQDQQIFVWDIFNESRQMIFANENKIWSSYQIEIVSYLNQYIAIYGTPKDNTTNFQIIYDLNSNKQQNSQLIQIGLITQKTIFFESYYLIQNDSELLIFEISYQQQNNLNQKQLFSVKSQISDQIQQIILTKEQNVYFLVLNNSIVQLDMTNQSSKEVIQLPLIKKVKIIQLENNSNQTHFIIQTDNSIQSYNKVLNSTNLTISDIDNQIQDFEVGNFSGINNQLIILKNNQQLDLYNFDENNQIQFILIQEIQLDMPQKALKKVQLDRSQNRSQQSYQPFQISFFTPTQIQVIQKNKNNLSTKIITNFNLPFPTPDNQVISMVQTYQPSILISCHLNGDINFYDSSKGINIWHLQKKNYNYQPCLQLGKFYDNKIVALMKQTLYLIDPVTQITLNQINNLQNIIQMSVNYDRLAINYDNCIQIFSSELKSLFLQCMTSYSSNNINITLSDNLKIIIQKQQQILLYQIDISQQQAVLLNTQSLSNTIKYFDFIKIYKSDQDIIQNNFFIDEITTFDSQSNFCIYDSSLTLVYQIKIAQLSSTIIAKRVTNDNQVYFVAGETLKKGSYSTFCISKQFNQPFLISTNVFYPIMEDPIKVTNGYGNTFYQVNRVMITTTYSMIKEYEIDIQRNITYISRHQFINKETVVTVIKNSVGSQLNCINYLGTLSGQIYSSKFQQTRYQKIPAQIMLKSSKDQIQEVISSEQIGMYFVRTNEQISSIQTFNHKFIEYLNPQLPTDKPFSSFRLTQKRQSIMCWNSQQVLLVMYNNTQSKKIYYKGMDQINGWVYDSILSQFYIYGTSLLQFDSSLNLIQTVISQQQNITLLSCLDDQSILACSVSKTLFIIFNKGSNQIQKINVSGFKNQFLISLDKQYSSIYLFADQIQIYNYNGSFNSTYNSLTTNFKSCNIYSTQNLFLSNEYIYFIDRLTLQPNQNYIGPQSLVIVNFIYIEFLQYVALYCGNNFFAQVYIIDTKTMKTIQSVNNPFPENSQGLVLKLDFDYNDAYLFYLDQLGNLYFFGVGTSITIKKNFKITEVVDKNEQLVSYSFNNRSNDMFVYSTNSIYYIDYSYTSKEYSAEQNEPNKLFAVIPIDNKNKEFLFFNKDNTIFRYSKFSINFINKLNSSSQIKDLIYDTTNDTLIIALTDTVLFYNKYQSTQNDLSISNAVAVQQILFHKFLLPNVYLTYQKQIIHCDIKTAKILNVIQLQQSVIITIHQSNQNNDKLFIGLSNGMVLQYNLNDQTYYYYSISNQSPVYASIITIILLENEQIGFFATTTGIVLKIDIQKQQFLEQINLISLVNEDPLSLLAGFGYDNIYQRYIFFFNGQKWSYIWNISTQKQEKYLSLPIAYTNKIKISQDFIIISCMFQINFYSLQQNIQLITIIKKNFITDQITDYKLVNNNIVIIFFIYKVEVFIIQSTGNSVLIFQQQYNYPRFLGYIFNQSNNFLKIYGLHQSGVFENDFSISIQQDNSISKCSTSISGNDIFYLKQKINNIYPRQELIDTINGQQTTNQQSWANLIYLQIGNNQLSNINQFISQNQFQNSQFIFSADANVQQIYLMVSNNTFQQYQKPSFQLFNYDLKFVNSTGQTVVTFNQATQQIKFQNITISNQCIDMSQIQITNINQVIINFMNILQISECNRTVVQQNFMTFENVSEVYIYNLNISSNVLQKNSKINFFAFENINKIIFDKITIQDNNYLTSIFSFIKVNKINISNITITDNKNNIILQNKNLRFLDQQKLIEFQYPTSILNFFGCQSVSLSHLNFSSNNEIQLIKSYNQYVMNDVIILLFNDEIQILDTEISSNKMSNNQIIYIQNQKVTNKNMTYKNNQGSFTIAKSEYTSVYQSTFENNTSSNGGAIYFQNIQGQLIFTQVLFQKNEAKSSGGALYFENLDNCQISFDDSTLITKNKALIGGGLRIVQNSNNYDQLPPNFPFYQNVKNNTADIYGDDSATYLQQIVVENDKMSDQNQYEFSFMKNKTYVSSVNLSFKYISIAQVDNFQSGGQLNLKIFIIDNYNRYLSFSQEKLLNSQYPLDIEDELKNIQITINNFETSETQLIGEKILNYKQYNTNNFAFQLTGLSIQGVLVTQQFLQIDSSIFDPTQLQNSILLILQFRNCQTGEIIQEQTSKINTCKYCSVGSYQLIDPIQLLQKEQQNKIDIKNECNTCPSSAIKCEGKTIQIKNGFWRQNNFTDEILQCNPNIGSCMAEDPQSINYCSVGYIGPLCQQCDILGDTWNQNRYSESFTKGICKECLELQIQWMFLILKYSATILYFLYTVFVFIRSFKYSQSCYYLRRMRLLPISKNSILDQSGFFIKIIISYYQLSSLLIPQTEILSVNINIFNNVFGQTDRQITLGTDCIVSKDLIRHLGKVQFYSILQFLNPLALLILTLLTITVLKFALKNKIKSYYYSTFIHIFLVFFQVSQISYFCKLLTCQQIGKQSLNPLDLEKECSDKQIIKYVYPSSILILLFWTFLPIIFLLKIRRNKGLLNYCKIKYNYGYYYSELKNDFYYWEFIRIYLKIILIYVYTLLQYNYQTLSASASSILIAVYIFMLKKLKPFISQKLLDSETLGYIFICLKIQLSQIQIQNTKEVIEVFIVSLDLFFFFYCGLIVVIVKARKNDNLVASMLRNMLQLLLPKKIYNEILKKRVTFKTYLLWKFISKNISNIIGQKAQQNINQLASKYQSQSQSGVLQLTESPKKSPQKQKQFLLKDHLSSSSSYLQSQKQSNFRLLKFNHYQDQTEEDNIIESQYSQQTEEKDPKKIQSYQLTPKQSNLIFSLPESQVFKPDN